jgi:hypothetical protein
VTIIIRNYDSRAEITAFPPLLRPYYLNLKPKPYSFSFIIVETLLSSKDSDLEAFSHNPTDGSFTALAFQLTVFTNYLIQRFLSY